MNRPMTLLLVSLLAGACAGCFPGRSACCFDFEDRHPSVRWAYRTGSQLGFSWCVPAIIRHCVTDLGLGSGCVIVKEGGPGGEVTAPWEHTVALRLKDGRPMWASKPIEHKAHRPDGEWDARDRMYFQMPNGLSACVTIPQSRDLYIGRNGWPPSRYIRLARLPKGQDFESTLRVISADQNTLILGFWGGHVVCVDTTLIPELGEPSSAPSSAPQGR